VPAVKRGNNKTPPPDVNRPRSFLVRYTRAFKLSALGATLIVAALMFTLFDIFVITHPHVRTAGHEQNAQQAAMPGHEKGTGENNANEANNNTTNNTVSGTVPAVMQDAANETLNKQDDPNIKLSQAPDPGLSEDTPQGSLPRVGDDGRKPWQVYARPFNTQDKRPRIGIVISDLSLSRLTTDTVLSQLPTNVTVAFDAESPVTAAWCSRARQLGHEVLLQIPMEPFDYPRSDPGTNTLLTTLPNSKNIERLLWSLHQGVGYVGVTTMTGSHFITDTEKLEPVLQEINKRGLLFFDAHIAPHSAVRDLATAMHLPAGVAAGRIDQVLTPAAVDQALSEIEKTVQLSGRAIIVVPPLPMVIDRLKLWIKDLPSRGIALAPISAMVE